MVPLVARQAAARRRLHRLRRVEVARQLVLHEVQKVAVMNAAIGQVHHLKAVERIAMPGGVDLGFENGVLDARKKAADAGEQIGPVGGVDQHLDTFADRRQARPDDGVGAVGAAPQHARLPGHVAGVETGKIAHVEMPPQRIGGAGGQAIQSEVDARLGLLGGDVGDGFVAAKQPRPRGMVEIFQQLAFPGIPYRGAGAADIGHGQQIEGRQPAQVAGFGGKRGNHLGVAGVLLLRGARHRQVHFHQPGDQFAIGLVEAVPTAKPPCIDRAQFGMVAAAAFGNIVKQGGQVEQFGFVEVGDQAAGERKLVRQRRHGEAPYVAQHGEDVLVDGVDVKQVVLHLPDDAAERRDVAPQQAVAMHRAQRPGDAQRLAQQRHEQRVVRRIGAEGGIDADAAAPQRAQRGRFEPGQRWMLGIQDEGAQQGIGLAFEQVGGARFEQVGAQLEVGVDRAGRRRHRKQPHPQ